MTPIKNEQNLCFFLHDLNNLIIDLEITYQKKYCNYYSDSNITIFIYVNKAVIQELIDKRKEMFESISRELQMEIDKLVHYFWVQLVSVLKQLAGDKVWPMALA